MTVSEFALKSTPPRMPRGALARAHLQEAWRRYRHCTVVVVAAPAGFGKTTLLLQWRRAWRESGMSVAWCTADEADGPARFVLALGHALRVGGTLELSGHTDAPGAFDPVDALTRLLAAIAEHGTPTGLVIDEAERLPHETVRGPLQYLLLNAPANLHVAIGTRVALPLLLSELVAKDQCALLGTETLRLRLEESDALLLERLGDRLTVDQRAQLHDATEGWPIGLQLAISAIELEPDPAHAARALSARHGTLQEYVVTSLFAHLPAEVLDALVRAAILEHFDAELFQAVTGSTQPDALLDRLQRETPLLVASERGQSLRLHPFARDYLLGRFEQLPPRERNGRHARACKAYADRGRFHEAATHALAAGNHALAHQHATRALWGLATGGRLAEAREWLDRLPRAFLAGDTELQLIAASVLALGDRNREALAIAQSVLASTDPTPRARAMALRIGLVSALFADCPGQLPGFLDAWPRPEEGAAIGPLQATAALNARAVSALHRGDTGQVRALVGGVEPPGDTETLRLSAAFSRMLVALSHLWDGRPSQVEAMLLPELLRQEQGGRRDMIACLYASFVALASYQRDQVAQARTLLAGRLDVIERCGFADNVACAYQALAGIALAEGDEAGALAALRALDAIGQLRDWPRLRAIALAEQARVHAMRGRQETAVRLVDLLESLAPAFDRPARQPLRAGYRLVAAIARAHVALALDRLEAAERHLAEADTLAESLQRGGDVQRVKLLRALVAGRAGSPSAAALAREARDLAKIGDYVRLAADTHPLAEGLLARVAAPRVPGVEPAAPDTPPLLTNKEAEILDLLCRGLQNKAIARALDVSGETVKWHLKNLFVKLSAASRRHAVERARMLGLVH